MHERGVGAPDVRLAGVRRRREQQAAATHGLCVSIVSQRAECEGMAGARRARREVDVDRSLRQVLRLQPRRANASG